MPAIGLNHYNLRAPRGLLEELRDFYCDVVGLKVGERPPFPSFGYWLYTGKDPVLHLVEIRAGETRATHTATTFDHAAFTCTDFAAMRAHLVKTNIEHTVQEVPLTGQKQIFFSDPAGNGVELNFAD